MFITFEGLDFCGKSTQVKLLKEKLVQLEKKVILIREPGGTQISEKVRDILLDKKNCEMHIEAELLLFSASRAQLVREKIIPLLKEGYFVISDRFHDSSIAYQGYGRGINLNSVKTIQEFAIGSAIPNITFFLDLPLDEIAKRRQKYGADNLDRIELSENDFYNRVRDGYIEISKNEKRFITIDGTKSIEEIHNQIINIVIQMVQNNE
ncbi:MAG: dTMP kinase [Ignavibacteriales bacterium CG18_big_fil_WC_8_21_14_2_50_31_20]|nr:MAG: dTMP kinase [Ignavibacteriales bacterium CG18_big_fil_WC_8_21_14_2_50_31_20]